MRRLWLFRVYGSTGVFVAVEDVYGCVFGEADSTSSRWLFRVYGSTGVFVVVEDVYGCFFGEVDSTSSFLVEGECVHDGGMTCRLSLPIFGLTVYKFKNSDWTQSGLHGIKKVSSLMNSTENWLRSLNVYHPDFCFFEEPQLLEVKGGEQDSLLK
ncbi:hypothetical protein CTI12_AA434220 [Artemisia annua]|uniref:Uncharacterized protein n=1 Tax=Artemisia annua TaxID=35608 RepID=A0A2U1LZH4_ARTAN|nr:hypothetical protein CTI12_AA434220 [Artemisia annua]